MEEKERLKGNFIFQLLYQALILIIPLIVSPYLTRCMGGKALGTYAYVNSIAYYFLVLANLGIFRHGQRIVARDKEEPSALRRSFWSLYVLHAALSAVVFLVYGIYFGAIYTGENRQLYLISALYVLSPLFDVTWLFYGLEKVKAVVVKDALIRGAECVAIFSLVHGPEDLNTYTAILASGALLGQLVMTPQVIALVRPTGFGWEDVQRHIKPLVLFSAMVIGITMYTVFDKTLLGWMTTKENVAYYEYANKIIGIPRTFVTVIGTVLFPRACRLAAREDVPGQKRNLQLSSQVVGFIGCASMFGLLAVGDLLAVVYFGPAFQTAGDVVKAMCALPLIIGLGDVLRTQYLIPYQKDKEMFGCIALNAAVNLVLSCGLTPILGIYGVVIGTCCAELVGLVCQMILCRRFVAIVRLLGNTVPFLAIGGVMYGAVRLVARAPYAGLQSLLLQIGVGAGVYCGLTLVYIGAVKLLRKNQH